MQQSNKATQCYIIVQEAASFQPTTSNIPFPKQSMRDLGNFCRLMEQIIFKDNEQTISSYTLNRTMLWAVVADYKFSLEQLLKW